MPILHRRKLFWQPKSVHDPAAGAGGYAGPGNVVSAATAWYGLRAYSAATIGANAIRLIRASDSAQQDFVTLASGALDIASVTSFLAATTGKVVTLYDQTGNGKDVSQSTDANRPAFTLSALGSLPGITFAGGNQELDAGSSILPWSGGQPFTLSIVHECTNAAFSTGYEFCAAGLAFVRWLEQTGTNDIALHFGSAGQATASLNTFYAMQLVTNGASSDICINGTSNTVNPGAGGASGTFNVGNDSGTHPWKGVICEMGFWESAFSGGQKTSMDTNQRTYWGL
jgi:hypothetical protein